MSHLYSEEMIAVSEIVRNLRKRSTKAEACFWKAVRNRQFDGEKFHRQYPVYFEYEKLKHFFVADFYCAKYKLIIEIDGSIHDSHKERDEYRTELLNLLGYQVIRFRNDEVIRDIDAVFEHIRQRFI